jgi:predicted nuclease of predicted toxin-antitoxin system
VLKLSLRILVDEDTQARRLIEMLRADGHDVLTIGEAGVTGIPDASVMELAKVQQRILLTRNCDDFLPIHEANPEHSGILAIYQDADPMKNMSYTAIVKAINNLQNTGLSLQAQFIVLNQYNW